MKNFFGSRLGIVTVTVIAIVLLIGAQRMGILRPVENMVTAALAPVQEFFTSAAKNTKELTGYFHSISALRKENEELKERVTALTDQNFRLENSMQEAAIAREELNYITDMNFNSVTAKVIGRTADEYLKTVIINKGDVDGIQIGYPVMTGSGVLIGTVIDTNSAVSKVLLLNDNQSEISAVIQNPTRSPGIVRGEFSLSLNMSLIPQSDSLAVGQTVTTSGLEERIPADLIIGTLSTILRSEGELFQEARIEPFVDYTTLRIVTVILPFDD